MNKNFKKVAQFYEKSVIFWVLRFQNKKWDINFNAKFGIPRKLSKTETLKNMPIVFHKKSSKTCFMIGNEHVSSQNNIFFLWGVVGSGQMCIKQ